LTVNSLGIIPTDSNFSPVLNVAYEVEEIKVSQTESHEQLTVLVSTNGSVNPAEAISEASKILIAHLNFFAELSNTTEVLFVDENVSKEIKNVSIPLIDLGLSVRSLNSLQREGIRDVTQLTEMTVGQLNAIDNLGTKSVREIKGALTKLGLSLKTNKN
jgi:DNA-directed RNA polymerase subunit alpha